MFQVTLTIIFIFLPYDPGYFLSLIELTLIQYLEIIVCSHLQFIATSNAENSTQVFIHQSGLSVYVCPLNMRWHVLDHVKRRKLSMLAFYISVVQH